MQPPRLYFLVSFYFVLSSLHSFKYWKFIYEILMKEISWFCLINPFFADKDLLKLGNSNLLVVVGSLGSWKKLGGLYLKIEK